MRSKAITGISLALLVTSLGISAAHAKGDDFNSVVKMIEQFYNVKHQGIPFLAKAGLKVVGAAAKIKGGEVKRLAEAGSIKIATFEDQDFGADFMEFRKSLNNTMTQTWSPLVQTISSAEGEQNYVFVRGNGDKFNVLIVNISQRDAAVIQATLSPKNLALLMKDPETGSKEIRQEATIDPE